MQLELLSRQRTDESQEEEIARVAELARHLRELLSEPSPQRDLGRIRDIGGTSHEVDAIVRPHAERLGFISQRTDLFAGYPTRLRPDWYLHTGETGILLEVERGKTLTNNMDLLDLWKCHICREARHLFLVVPVSVSRTRNREVVFDRVVARISTFFETGNEVNVLSVAVLGYP